MEDVVELLKKLFSKDTRYHTRNEIKKLLKLKGEVQERILDEALNELVETGVVINDNKGYRTLSDDSKYVFGKIEINKSGTGFVHTASGHTILIENLDLNGALDGDSVIVSNIDNKRKDYYHGKIHKIVKRNNGKVIFEVVGNGKNSTLIPYNYLENICVNINQNECENLIDGDLIVVNVGCVNEYGCYKGTIDKIIGHKDDPNIDIKVIAEKYNIPIEFSDEVLKEANNLPKSVTNEDIADRIDLRNETVFTIDCDNTKDRDDAISIQKFENGNYLLKVSIAHVSHYIKKDSLLFKEALKRTSSHYPLNTCIPMLPHVISNGICSLNPNVDRLTRTVEMEINKEGEVVNYNIYPSIINSKIAMSYSKVNKLLNGEKIEEYEPYKKELKLLDELNEILEKARKKRNYIDFNIPEINVEEDKNNNPIRFYQEEKGKAEAIIENAMLVANNTVYSHFSWHILAYRVHELPDAEKVYETIKLLNDSGIKIPKIAYIDSKHLKSLIEGLKDDEISNIIKEALLKSMMKAKYDIVNFGHFALQYDTYGHFTSPIRRIIDLVTHMTIDNVNTFDYSLESIKKYEEFLIELCKRTNEIEKIDKLIETEAIDMKMAEYMKNHIGEKFDAYITDISSHSMFVKTDNQIRGKVKIDDMHDDKYYYDYDKKAIIGRSNKKKYQIGNRVVVLVKDASKENRAVYFEIPSDKVLVKKK